MPNQVEDKKKILLRVRKIKGQTQAIEKALEDREFPKLCVTAYNPLTGE